MPQKKIALQLIEETLKEQESPKGSLLSAIQKLQRTADIINDDDKKYGVLFNQVILNI